MVLEKIRNNKFLKFLEKHEKGVFLFFTMLFCLLYYLSYSIHNIPYTSGWGNSYADLVFSGKIPYKDFYYYLPPLNLIIDCILWKMSFGKLFIYVLFRIAERMLIMFLVYKLLCKFAKPRHVCIGVILGSIIFAATVYDIIGDYNQTSLLLNILLTMIYVKYIETSEKKKLEKKEYKYLLLGGVLLGLAFLHKQTIFLAQCIIFFIVLTAYFIITHRKKYIKSVMISLLGMLIPIIIAIIILAINGAFLPFIDQVYLNVDAKGSIINILGSIVTACFKVKYLIVTALIILYLYISRYFRKKNIYTKKDKILKYSIKTFLAMQISMIIVYLLRESIQQLPISLIKNPAIFLGRNILLLIVLDFIMEKCFHKDSIWAYICTILVMVLATIFIYNKKLYALFLYASSFAILTDIATVSTLGSIILIIYLLYLYHKNKDITTLKWAFAFTGGLAFAYNAMMGGIVIVSNYGLMFLFATLITYILSKVCEKERIIKYFIYIICIFVPVISMSQKVVCAYSWWGWQDKPINSSSFYTIDVPGLEGFRVSKNVKNMYEEMYKVIKSNTNEESIIYGYPHVRIFNVLLKNTNMNYFVPVPFYDVCSDDYMKEDVKRITEIPPDIIIWIDIPDCIKTHEDIYRDGKKLEQRKIQEWLSKCVKQGEYILIGQYDSMFIYKLNDGTQINYTYYKKEDAENKTLNEF